MPGVKDNARRFPTCRHGKQIIENKQRMKKEIISCFLSIVLLAVVVIALVVWLPRFTLAVVAMLQLMTVVFVTDNFTRKKNGRHED